MILSYIALVSYEQLVRTNTLYYHNLHVNIFVQDISLYNNLKFEVYCVKYYVYVDIREL